MRACVAACLVSCATAPDEPAATPTNGYAEAMLALRPVGYWRLAEHDTDVMLDAMATTNGGYHSGPRLGDPGFSDNSAHFDGNAQYGEIADRAAFSLTRAWDDFDRTALGSWGGAWSGTNGNVSDGTAWFDPHGHSGTFEQALDVRLARGNLQIRAAIDHAAIALVAERFDAQQFVRAELRDTSGSVELHLIATANGVDTDLASVNLGDPGGWWYLRFEFDGPTLRARAWRDDEPATWLQATSATDSGGTIAIRATTSSPVLVQAFRAQTLGLSIHAAIRLDEFTGPIEQILGKGNHSGFFSSTDQEFHMRVDRDADGLLLKGYAFNLEGGHGSGQAFAITPAHWYDVVLEFDPGDYHDVTAGVSMYVDDVALPNDAGSRYQSKPCIPSHEVCWSIDPRGGDAPLRIGTSDGSSFFAGNIDELAIFDRLLTVDEITSLRR